MPKKQKEIIVTGVIVDETNGLTVSQFCRLNSISEETVFELVEHGLFHSNKILQKNSRLDSDSIQRLEAVLRIWHDLDVNLTGAILVREMSEKIEELGKELEFLRKYLDD